MSSTAIASLSTSTLVSCLLAACCLLAAVQSASIVRRSASEGEEPECPGRQPCGWLVYNKSTRNMEFFMNNTCICAPHKHCHQTDDDLSVGAYVYRCIEKNYANNPTQLMPS